MLEGHAATWLRSQLLLRINKFRDIRCARALYELKPKGWKVALEEQLAMERLKGSDSPMLTLLVELV